MRQHVSMSVLAAASLLVVAAGDGAAQELARRVSAVGTGHATFSYPARADVEICDRGVIFGGGRIQWRGRVRDEARRCVTGTASVELRVADGVVRDVDVLELDEIGEPGAQDLGVVGAREAADYFLSLARAGGAQDAAEDAVFAAMLADVEDVWRDLFALARDPTIQQDVRESSLFWLGQEAGDAVTSGIAAIAADEREEQDVREAAIFALSQRPSDVVVATLMELARTAREAETRQAAMFWLAQSDDPRVLAFFEEILLGR
jgi:hypothetical protein